MSGTEDPSRCSRSGAGGRPDWRWPSPVSSWGARSTSWGSCSRSPV